MSARNQQPVEHRLINAELSETLGRFQAQLDARLQDLSIFEKRMMVVGLGLATCMEVGTTTAVNIILPDMQGNVGASADETSWVITVYSAAFLSALPLSTWFARHFGHRNHLVVSILLYTLGAMGCFLSHELWVLLLARAVMGFGGGALLVRSETTLYRLFQGRDRGKHMLLFGTVIMSTKAIMPLIFGAVTDWIVWNDAFLLLVPLGLGAAALLYLFMPNNVQFQAEPPPPDFAGIGLLIAGVTAFQIIASRGEQDNWFGSMNLRCMFVVGLMAIVAFIWRDSDLKNPNPLLNLRLIAAERTLSAGLGVAILFGGMLGAGLYVLPQYLRSIEGYSASQTGGFFLVDGLASLAGLYLVVNLMPRVNISYLIGAALFVFVAGNFAFVHILTGDTPAAAICLALALHGLSIGILLPGVATLLLGQIDLRVISFGAAIFLFFRQLGTSVGVSATVAFLDIRQTHHSSRLLDTANRLDPKVAQTIQNLTRLLHSNGLDVNSSVLGANRLFGGLVNTQARLLAFIDVYWALQILGLAAIALLFVRVGARNPAAAAPSPAIERVPVTLHA